MLDRYHGWAVSEHGEVLGYEIVTSVELLHELPKTFSLSQNYPNPFNPSTNIEYELPERAHVFLKVHDDQGRDITTLVDQEQWPGVYRIRFNAGDLASGVYFYTIETEQLHATKQLIIVK